MKKKSFHISSIYRQRVGIIALILAIINFNSFAQIVTGVKDQTNTYSPKKATMVFPISCATISSPNCNYIQNNNFHTPNPGDAHNQNVFGDDLVLPWNPGQGSCEIYPGGNTAFNPGSYNGNPPVFTSPPSPATSFAFGAAGWSYLFNYNMSENIVQKIPAIIPGHVYVLSFFVAHKDYSPITLNNIDYPLDRLNIHLINCDDYNATFDPNEYSYPPIPSNSQQIYCQDNITNHVWQRVFVHFVGQRPNPSQPLNMIWVWPEENTEVDRVSGMFFAFPELIDITDYANQVQQAVPPNCIATLPSCGPTGSEFTWVGPPGSTIIPPTPVNIPITIDVNNPLNVGTWTLTLTVPSADITTGNCNTTGSFSTTVEVLACGSQPWPKVYEALEQWVNIKVDNYGNILSQMMITDMANNINHNGLLASNPGTYCIQYNKISGATDWLTDDPLSFTLSSGITQFIYGSSVPSIYRNNLTGSVTLGPLYVPTNETILAEDNGTFITKVGDFLYTRNTSGFNYITIPSYPWYNNYGIVWSKYNPTSRNLFTNQYYYNHLTFSFGFFLAIYHLDITNNTLSLVNNPFLDQMISLTTQVNSGDEVFMYGNNGQIQKYDYSSHTATDLVINNNNFNNNSLSFLYSDAQNVEDRIITFSAVDNKLYCINTQSLNDYPPHIPVSPPLVQYNPFYSYVFDGIEDLYISGGFSGSGMSIGNQTIPLLGNFSSFLTKFKIVDFLPRQFDENLISNEKVFKTEESYVWKSKVNKIGSASTIEATLSPNPAKNILQVNIKQAGSEKNKSFLVSITNSYGITVLTQNSNQKMINVNVSQFKTGFYYVSISTDKGDKTTQMFIKE